MFMYKPRMSEVRDPAIKLFGKTMSPGGAAIESEGVPEGCCDQNLLSSTIYMHEESTNIVSDGEDNKNPLEDEITEDKQEELKDLTTSSGISEDRRTSSVDKETSSLTSSQEKSMTKPDKILPCPRCTSMDTKFCYYNNYNISQPRHFCKNCQRYWTSGGTMRNVPVGAGRRKNKSSSASHYRHIMVSNAANGLHNPSLGSNGSVLSFGSDSPLSESVNPGFNLPEKTQNCIQNGYHRLEQRFFVSCGGDNGDDDSTGSTITATNSSEKEGNGSLQESMVKNYQGFPPQVPCFPGTPWPYPWNSATPQSAFCPSSFPVSFYPVPTYWGCPTPGYWNIPCLSPQPSSLNPSTRALGKHSRDGDILNPVNTEKEEPIKENKDSERCVWIPKTLRIDDPIEAAKSSIWATLGIKHEKTNSFSGGGLFKAFQSKGDGKNHLVEPSAVLQANPAALCRSLSFQEHT